MENASYLDFFTTLMRQLAHTGKVEPLLLLCQDQVPDGGNSVPFVRLPERSRRLPREVYDWQDLTAYERFLSEREGYLAGRTLDAAVSLCAETEAWLDTDPVDCLLVWSGTRLVPRAVGAAARQQGVPVITLETPFFQVLPDTPPDHPGLRLHRIVMKALIWDTVQGPQCGPSQITREWARASVRRGLPAFLHSLHESRQSKFSRADVAKFLAGESNVPQVDEVAADLARPAGARVLLACGQLNWDSSMFYAHHLVRRWQDLLEAAGPQLPPGWVLWFKAHPLDVDYQAHGEEIRDDFESRFPGSRFLPPGVNIHDAIQAADAVLCINSNVGLEATTYGKPVVTLGEGPYTGKGFTYDVPALDELGEVIAGLPEVMPPERLRLRDRYLSYLLYDYLLPVGRPERAVARLEQAVAQAPPRPARRPLRSAEERVEQLEAQLSAYVRYLCLQELPLAREHALSREIAQLQEHLVQRDTYARSLEEHAGSLEQRAASLEGQVRYLEETISAQASSFQEQLHRYREEAD